MKEINVVICLFIALVLLILGALQCKGKGPLLNNTRLFSSQLERAGADKKRFYRQSGAIFLLLGAAFLFMAVWVWTDMAVFAAPMALGFIAALAFAFRS